jgi:hypothetical protein
MGYVLIPLLILLVKSPSQGPSPAALADFARLSKSTGQMVSLVVHDGTAREGRLISATADAVTMEFARGPAVFAKADIASAEKLRDGTRDGFIKGAVFGALLGLAVFGTSEIEARGDVWLRVVGTYGAIGWAFDAMDTNRQAIYRAAPAPAVAPKAKLSFRF